MSSRKLPLQRGRMQLHVGNTSGDKNASHHIRYLLVRQSFWLICLLFFHQGLGKEFIFSHHQKAYEGNRISWYDQQFNKREIAESKLPPLRSWDRQKLAWAPEKSDYPIQGVSSQILDIMVTVVSLLMKNCFTVTV